VRKRLPLMRTPAKPVISTLILAMVSLPAWAQNAAPSAEAPAAKAPAAEAPQAAITRTQPTAPIPANAPRFASSGLEIKISSFGLREKDQNRYVSVGISVILINNNDYDVGVLNMQGFSLIDDAGNALSQPGMGDARIAGIATCDYQPGWCLDESNIGMFVPYDKYTVISARTAIPTTYYTKAFIERGDVGDMFTFTTKLALYKVPAAQEGGRKSRIETPRLITVGIPNIIAKPND